MTSVGKEVDPAIYKRITETGIQGDLSKFSEDERSVLLTALLAKTKLHCVIANPTDFQFYTKIVEDSTALIDFSFSINYNNAEAQEKLHQVLQKNSHLTRLSVGSKIGRDKTIEALAKMPKVEEFDVYNFLFEHEAALLLPILKSGTLRGLHLRSEIYSNETFWPEFSTLLENNTSLESLSVYGNDDAILGVSSALKKNKTLKQITVAGKLSVAGMKSLFEALEHNSTIEKVVLPMLADDRNEELVNFWKAVGEGRIHVRNFDLTQVNLTQAEYEALGEALKTNKSVDALKLTVDDVEYLQLLCNGLRTNTCLKELDLTNSNLDQDCIKTLSEALGLRTDVPKPPQETLPEQTSADPEPEPDVILPVNTTLTTLNLEMCKIKNADLLGALLKQNSSLTSLNVSRNSLSYGPICEALKTNRTITELDIQVRDRPSQEDLTLLRDMLTLNDTLRALKLSVVQEELDSLCEGLKSNRGVTTLIIKEKRWNNPAEETALVLEPHHEEMLSQNATLTTVDIFLPRQVIPQLESILTRNKNAKSEGTA